jgi:hypothetical protein
MQPNFISREVSRHVIYLYLYTLHKNIVMETAVRHFFIFADLTVGHILRAILTTTIFTSIDAGKLARQPE